MKPTGIIALLLTILLWNSPGIYAQTGTPATKDDNISRSHVKKSKFNKAEELYNQFAYSKATKLYEKLYKSGYQKSTVSSRLATCYRRTGKTSKAEKIYAEIVSSSASTPEDLLYYAQMLRSNGKYNESQQWMEKFHNMDTVDTRGKMYTQTKEFVSEIDTTQKCKVQLALGLNSTYSDFGVFAHHDTILFTSSRKPDLAIRRKYSWDNKPFLNMYTAVKTNKGYSSIKTIRGDTKSKYHDGPACLAENGTVLYFTRNNYTKKRRSKAANNLKIYKCTVQQGKVSEPLSLPINSNEYSVGHPSWDEKNHRLYFTSDMPGGIGGTDIYYVNVNTDGSFGKPINLGFPVNTEGNEMFPFYHESGSLFFSSNGHVGLGSLDIFIAKPDEEGNFNYVANMGVPINSMNDDFSLFMDKQQKTGYLSSNRPSGPGDDDIYTFELNNPIYLMIPVKIIAQDKETGVGIGGAAIKVQDEKGNIYKETIAGNDGSTKFISAPDKDYDISAVAKGYLENSVPFSTKNITDTKELTVIVPLEKKPDFTLVCIITDRNTGKPVSNAKIIITENKTNKEIINYTTGKEGGFRKPMRESKINDILDYKVTVRCDGYFEKSVNFYKKLTKPGDVIIHEELDIQLDKVKEGTDLSRVINLERIYFDLDKWNIRPDAAKELDKIVQIMVDYKTMVVELRAHTDSRGTDAYNMRLSAKRAKSSVEYIISKGISPKRISWKEYGESRLVNRCKDGINCDEDEHQMNRRTEFYIIKM